uniref:VQ motif-containing protein 22-like n=1 Tax=Erigeron canadensis TaxID=72917 RepID=UPI001CB9070E|nr:VQ motif-containing protein 22-like [Erigeron canadensis]
MSGTMSRSNNQWQQFYQTDQPTMVQSWSSHATTDATNMVTTTTNTNTNTNMNTSVSNQLNRVTRPNNPRRRSRASRRTPTTLLNTDTTNFRAMVQRFTGGGNNVVDTTSSTPYLSNDVSSVTSAHQFLNTSYNSNTSSFNDGVGLLHPMMNDDYNVQFRAPNNDPYFMMTVADGGSTTAGNDGDDQHRGFRQKRVL